MTTGTVAARVAKGLVGYAVARGVDRRRLLEAGGLSGETLDAPERRIPFDVYMLLMRAARAMSGDPAFALRFGEAVDIRELSLPALLGQSLGTAMDVLDAVNRYARLDVDVEIEGERRLDLVGKAGRTWLVDRRASPNVFPELTESVFARMVAAGRRTGLDMPIREVHVTHADPGYRDEYERVFRVPVRFGRDWNALAIDPAAMAERIALQPAYAGAILAQHAERLLCELDAGGTNRGKAEAVLRPLLARRRACAGDVAAALGISRQTLYRRLKAEGTTFARLIDATRLRLARELLEDGGHPMSEVAERLGFADGASFSKAFKRWTGLSPGRFRGRAARVSHGGT